MRKGWANRNTSITLIAPIILAVLILVIIAKVIFSGDSTSTSESARSNGGESVNIVPKKESKVSIFMSSDSETELSGPAKMFPTDKMVKVTSGDADIEIEGSVSRISIENLSEVQYNGIQNGKHTFTLLNGYAWVESPSSDVVFKLKNFSLSPVTAPTYIVNQNTRASNVYVLRGNLLLSTPESGETPVGINQMLSLLSSDTKGGNLGEKVSPLDDFIKQTSIFEKKDGASLLAQSSQEQAVDTPLSNASGSTTPSLSAPLGGRGIRFTFPEDNATVDTQKITIEGVINSPDVAKIIIEKKEALILAESKTFSLKDFDLPDTVNDLSYRVLDINEVVIDKGILTVNVSGKRPVSTIKKPDVVTFPVSSKDFKIISPGVNPFKTTDTSVKIRGSFAPNIVKSIRVNTYQLQQFKQFGTSWVYNASIENGNMEEWVNEYLVTYFGPSDEVLATTKLYIVKESLVVEPTIPAPVPVSPTSSGATNPS